MRRIHGALVISTLTVLAMIVSTMDARDQELSQQLYCEDVALWNEFSGIPALDRPGHPDFDNRYERDCR